MEDWKIIGSILLVVVLLCFSAFFSAAETAFTSVKEVRLKTLANEGDKRAKKALAISENFDKLLVTILVGNNFVNIFASSIMSAVCAVAWGEVMGVIASTLITLFTLLLFGEITPKTLAKANPEKYVLRFAGALGILIKVFSPLSYFFMKPKKMFESVNEDEPAKPSVTEEELAVLVEEIQEQGELEEAESELIKSALEFDDKTVAEILIPRVDVFAVPNTITVEELKNSMLTTGFSRIPMYKDTIDNVIGIVYRKDFFVEYFENPQFSITDILRPANFLPESATVQTALNTLQKSMVHMLIIVDEFGGMAGVVTMEDVLEELIGEVYDETDEKQNMVVRNEDGSFIAMGDADMDEVFETIGTKFDLGDYDGHTLSGYIQYRLNRIPVRDDRLVVNPEVKIFVRSVKKRRVKAAQIIVRLKQAAEEQ